MKLVLKKIAMKLQNQTVQEDKDEESRASVTGIEYKLDIDMTAITSRRIGLGPYNHDIRFRVLRWSAWRKKILPVFMYWCLSNPFGAIYANTECKRYKNKDAQIFALRARMIFYILFINNSLTQKNEDLNLSKFYKLTMITRQFYLSLL